MKPNKILGIQGFFLLPDDFNGSYIDALRLLADYHEKEGLSNPQREVSDGNSEATWKDMWTIFLDHITKDKGRSAMTLSVSKLSKDKIKMEKMIDFKKEKLPDENN